MDYGRFLSATFNNAQGKSTFDQKGSAANKGIAIKLGKEGNAAMVFDTDLLRMAGGWTGGYLKYTGVVFDGAHGPNPKPPAEAQIVFETNPTGPGWSQGDDFKDPRPLPTGPGAAKIPFGPLPKTWAKYKGLYLHGDDVVLAYTVGTAAVLELPSLEVAAEQNFLTRTFQVVDKGAASRLLVAEGAEGATAAVQGDTVVLNDDPKKPDSRVVIGAIGLPRGAAWEIVGQSRVELKLPAFAGNEQFQSGLLERDGSRSREGQRRARNARQARRLEAAHQRRAGALGAGGHHHRQAWRFRRRIPLRGRHRRRSRPTTLTSRGFASAASISSPMAASRSAPGAAMSGSAKGSMRSWRKSPGTATPRGSSTRSG